MANSNNWGDGAANNAIGWGQGANNAIGWGSTHATSWAGLTDIVGVTTDSDAAAFITAAAITNETQKAAINTLVTDLKGYSIWSKMKALYPFVGSTASQHKFNLKDPRDLDAAFRLVFSGGWTHSVNGVLPNGTNAFADTKFNINNFTSASNLSIGSYFRNNTIIDGYDFGQGFGTFSQEGVLLFARGSSSRLYYSAIGNTASTLITNTNSSGFYVITRGNTTEQNLHIRVSQTVNNTQTRTVLNNYASKNIFLGAINNAPLLPASNPAFYSNRQQALTFMADYLTQAEVDNLTTAVQAFQTTLGRQV
jgi:hypothetical protein